MYGIVRFDPNTGAITPITDNALTDHTISSIAAGDNKIYASLGMFQGVPEGDCLAMQYDIDDLANGTCAIKQGVGGQIYAYNATMSVDKNGTIVFTDGNAGVVKKWILTRNVVFNNNDGSVETAIEIVNGKLVAPPVNPARAGFAFAGWYSCVVAPSVADLSTDPNCAEYDFAKPVVQDLKIFASWDKSTVNPDQPFPGAPNNGIK